MTIGWGSSMTNEERKTGTSQQTTRERETGISRLLREAEKLAMTIACLYYLAGGLSGIEKLKVLPIPS